ncbi:hypothetical protein CAB88_29095 (plasmid) [Bacillus thuringiensis]|uniref:Uncharacterized protein n=2 Tax=Bacillus thuringiensis TaxID=1428 RepID=A0A1W6WXR9_BACTU|nr:hypothetical protein CAB88_29095 [Bacillus thuringiensis]ERH96539.1 hypothetical protein BTCBT_007325 [Bacillus thuringiensis T01-328]OTW37393.1 hypothetical protein BK698_32485 [Bacillus thuringiensis serovar thuringiensis]
MFGLFPPFSTTLFINTKSKGLHVKWSLFYAFLYKSSSTYSRISTLHIKFSLRIVKYPILYLQKIRRILIKIMDMRTSMIKCEYYFTNIVGNTNVIELI